MHKIPIFRRLYLKLRDNSAVHISKWRNIEDNVRYLSPRREIWSRHFASQPVRAASASTSMPCVPTTGRSPSASHRRVAARSSRPMLMASAWRGSAPHSIAKARSEEHTSELQSLMRPSYADFCLKNKKQANI